MVISRGWRSSDLILTHLWLAPYSCCQPVYPAAWPVAKVLIPCLNGPREGTIALLYPSGTEQNAALAALRQKSAAYSTGVLLRPITLTRSFVREVRRESDVGCKVSGRRFFFPPFLLALSYGSEIFFQRLRTTGCL